MNSLAELRAWFLEYPDDRVHIFELADQYLQAYEKLGKNFILPHEAAKVRPVIECFASDPGAYAVWLRGLKAKHLQRGSVAANTVAKLVKTLTVRALQVVTRERYRQALDLAIAQGKITASTADKDRYIKRLVKVWGMERKKMLIVGLSQTERSELVKEFWAMIDARLTRGEVPDA